MKILVTGGAGFIGSNYVRKVISGELTGVSEVTVLDKLTYSGSLKNLEMLPIDSFRFIKGDIRDGDLLKKIISDCDAVLNFAAESHVDRSILGAEEFVQTNIVGTQTILNACKSRNDIKLVQISTDEVYGSIELGAWDENSPLLPNSPYSASKASADLLVRSYVRTFGLNACVTRCSNNYGPFQYPEKVIPLFITNLLENEKVPLYGKGENVRDWLHVDDHCRGIHLVLTDGISGEIYNIGGGKEMSNKQLTFLLLSKFGKSLQDIDFVKDRPGHDFRYSLNCDKISRDLGYSPMIEFEEGIVETINWYRENEAWWRPLKRS